MSAEGIREKQIPRFPRNETGQFLSRSTLTSVSAFSEANNLLPAAPGYAFLFTTSSMLVPKSLRMTVAAFRPGPPVTEPPGCVVAPV